MPLYEIGILGNPSANQLAELEKEIDNLLTHQGLTRGGEVAWTVAPASFDPPERTASTAAFFGAAGVDDSTLENALTRGLPILPIASSLANVSTEIPASIAPLNCLGFSDHGPLRIATALLEMLGLLPRQRRVFISYRRSEATDSAIQLFEALSARVFDVFLDTHGVAPGEEFQSILWHRLCDCDVLVMLDTATYFDSRWTAAEFGRALAKNISILRVGWPSVPPSSRVNTASRIDLSPGDILASGLLSDTAINNICERVESLRSLSHAVRMLNLHSRIRDSVQVIGGVMTGVGLSNTVSIQLPSGEDVLVYPTTGVPTSMTLNSALDLRSTGDVAVVYDHIGLLASWQKHLDWLGQYVTPARWVKAEEMAWTFAGWNV